MKSEVMRFSTADFLIWILVGVTLFFYTPAMDVFNFPKQWLLVCLTTGLVLHFILGGKKNRIERDYFSNLIVILLFGICLSITLSAIFSDTSSSRILFGYPGRANGLLTYFCVLAIVWIATRTRLSENFYEKLNKWIILTYLIFGLYATLQVLNLDPVSWNNPFNRVIGTLGNPNFSGAFLGTGAVAMLFSSFKSTRRARLAFIVLASWLLVLAISTQSVQALAIFIIGISLLLAIFIYKRFTLKTFLSLLFSLMISGLIIASGLLGFGPLGEKLFEYTLRLRLEYWRIGVEIAREYPLIGIGPDSYIEGFRRFRGAEFVGEYSQSVYADSAHNVLINFMANFGIPAFILMVILMAITSWKAIKLLFAVNFVPNRIQTLALIWLLMLIQSLFSIEQIGLNVFQWVCGSLLLNTGKYEISSKSKHHLSQAQVNRTKFLEGVGTEISILAIIISMVFGWNFMRQEVSLLKISSTPLGTTLSESDFQKQVNGFNFFVKNEVRRAMFLSNLYLNSGKYEESETLMQNVVENNQDAVEAIEQLAKLARFRNDLPSELIFRKRMEIIDPYNYGNLLLIAQLSSELSNSREAVNYARLVLSMSRDEAINESATAVLKSSS